MGGLILIPFWLMIVAIYVLRYYYLIGFPTSYTLTPFQVGMLYRRGRPIREVGPGRHRVISGIEKIYFLDKRPIQANFEDRAVALADGAIAVYGFTSSAQVCQVKKALYASATYTQVPAFVTLCATRSLLNGCRSDQLRAGRAAIEAEMIGLCRSRLAAAGFELNSFRLTELRFAAPAPVTTNQ
jgi:hypothetical protein